MQRIQLQLPPVTTLTGLLERRKIWVGSAGKAPKLRFQPGSFICYKKKLYEIIYAYRVEDNPQEWLYACEVRDTLTKVDPIGDALEKVGCGEFTPRVVYEIFRDSMQAHEFFCDIPVGKNRITFSNKKLVQKAELVSSGQLQ